MRVTFKGSNLNQSDVAVSQTPYTLAGEAQITVGLVAVVLVVPAANLMYQLILANRSGAAQNIRVGVNPVFGPPAAGFLLAAGDGVVLPDTISQISAIADAAGALLDCLIYQRAYI